MFWKSFCKRYQFRSQTSPVCAQAQTLFNSVLTAVKRKSMRNALVLGPGRGNFPREILIETIAENVVTEAKYSWTIVRNTLKLHTSCPFFLLILHPFLINLLLLQGLDSVSSIHPLPYYLYKNIEDRFNQINSKLSNFYNKNNTKYQVPFLLMLYEHLATHNNL